MIDIEAGFFTAMLLLVAMLGYLWFTRADPGGRELPGIPARRGEHPYPELSAFPFPEPAGRSPDDSGTSDMFGWVNPSYSRLATTGELRALAYAGDMDAVNSEVAAFKAMLLLGEWTGGQLGNPAECLLCKYEAQPDAIRRQAVIDAIGGSR